jgi:hypothetical protein
MLRAGHDPAVLVAAPAGGAGERFAGQTVDRLVVPVLSMYKMVGRRGGPGPVPEKVCAMEIKNYNRSGLIEHDINTTKVK